MDNLKEVTILTTHNKLEGIQALRAIAALCVVSYHIDPIHRGGFGVDIFFVLSGFIISYVSRNSISVSDFIKNRITRIIPLYWGLTLCISLFLSTGLVTSSGEDISIASLLKSLLFIPYNNLDGVPRPILGLGWTLNYEMYFYALYAISLSISHKYRDIITTALLLLLFKISPMDYYRDQIVMHFIIGMIAANIQRKVSFEIKNFYPIIIIVAAMFALDDGTYEADIRVLHYGPPSALLIILGCYVKKTPSFLASIGNWSYSLYLIHIYVIVTFTRTLGDTILSYCVSVALALIVSYLLFRFFEKPSTMYLRKLFYRPS